MHVCLFKRFYFRIWAFTLRSQKDGPTESYLLARLHMCKARKLRQVELMSLFIIFGIKWRFEAYLQEKGKYFEM